MIVPDVDRLGRSAVDIHRALNDRGRLRRSRTLRFVSLFATVRRSSVSVLSSSMPSAMPTTTSAEGG
jgi:hypothetical protein